MPSDWKEEKEGKGRENVGEREEELQGGGGEGIRE